MPFDVPAHLSPSSISAFKKCPLAFRFAYIERLPTPPSPAASKGTLVHKALEKLFTRPSAERSLDAALADFDDAAAELATDPEFTGLDFTPEEVGRFRAEAVALVTKYFDIEDPTTISPHGVELMLSEEVGTDASGAPITVKGIIDRLDVDDHGDFVVTDYKTGRAPGPRFVDESFTGVHIYALLCEKKFGRRPTRVQHLYLASGETISAPTSDSSIRVIEKTVGAVRDAVVNAVKREHFAPKPGKLCNWCDFQEFCPSFGGDPNRAAVTLHERAAVAAGRPPLPLNGN